MGSAGMNFLNIGKNKAHIHAETEQFEALDRVKTIILKYPRVISINALWGRNSGPFQFIEADIVIKANNLEKAHSVCQKIEGKIKKHVFHSGSCLDPL